jgi:sulfate transport system permease protein
MAAEATVVGREAAGALVPRRATRIGLRSVALLYLVVLLIVPVGLVFYRAFEPGLGALWSSITTPAAISAFWLTITVTAIAVPLNTVFGVITAIAIVRGRFRGRALLDALIDLPFAVSPVVVGLALVLVYARPGWFGKWFIAHGIPIIFATPGLVLATIFVSLPFVVREVAPVLRELGDESEQAAATLGAGPWQTFSRITLPALRWAIAYGVVLSLARAIGEFGAVSVVSGHIAGQTNTLTLLVEARLDNLDTAGAYAASALLAAIAIVALLAMTLLRPRRELR